MTGARGYAVVGGALLAVLVGVLWPWLDAPGRRGILAAAAVAWPVQVVAFALLVRYRSRMHRFLAVWAGGTLVRLGLIGGVAFALTRVPGLAVAPTLLGLAGFLFGLLLLEPVFFRLAGEGTESEGASGGP